MNRIEGEVYKNIGLDTSNIGKDKTQKNVERSTQENTTLQEESNTQGYKLELSSIAKSLKPDSGTNLEDMKKKIEEIKAKISNGTYEVDTNKIVQGLLKYF